MVEEAITQAQAQQKMAFDKWHTQGTIYNAGQKVWLVAENIHTQQPTVKLSFKKYGPFEILEQRQWHIQT